MPISERDYMREKHPPACTCVACEKRRMGRVKSRSGFKKPLWRRIFGRVMPWMRD